ncbi:MAG: hypothetical protein MUF81_05860 [Verrucomicrobia bacterium]|jgi:hypothetical protein|nr:hypothetical protein [Verrucomicrobiota bacterium]
MKNKQNIPLRLLVLSALLLAVSTQINPRAYAVEFKLSSECTSNKLNLIWYGAPAIELQQATNLANPVWLDVPGSKGMSFREIPMTNPLAFFRLVDKDPPGDIDGDGLDGWFETNGWTIFIDTHGYGTDGLVERHVTSDPSLGDTDGDGVEDFWEWLLGTDPRATDTDGDGLSDGDEWFKWHTSPTSVDTDGDARGPNHNLPPKAQLFDGNELRLLHTSPTLEDTDGDGRTDYEEYDQPGRSPLVAQLPKLKMEMVDAVDIRLDVQYAEEAGQSRQYGGELSTSDTTSTTWSSATCVKASLTIGAQISAGLAKAGFETETKTEATFGLEETVTFSGGTSKTTENSYSDYTTDSRTRTETAASGSMSGGIRLVNTGPITYTLKDFGLTVRYWSPGNGGPNREFKTLATLVPALGANGITLAPGDSTPVLQVQATGLNADRVKEFIARPNSLYLEPAFYELENAEGLNFDYLEEVTRWRTARVEIDYGNGTNEEYRVATNVERKENGDYAGVTMGFVMTNILHIPFQTTNLQALVPTNATNESVVYSIRNVVTTSATNGFWIVGWSGDRTLVRTNFEDITLQAGESVLLSFIRDDDGDGLFAPEEQHYGTTETPTPGSPQPGDSDGDGLLDVFEARTGWNVIVLNQTNHVYSDPSAADQDGDGLNDSQEYQLKTDPTRPDTDDDGLADGVDPHPTVPAKVLRVKADAVHGGNSATNGATWATALTNLQDALKFASNGLATTSISTDDVAEIWVAAGVYKPTPTTTNRAARFELVNNTAVYGGFSGVETKLSQRESDPIFNGTVLSGDLMNNDASTYSENTNSFTDNSYNVCWAEAGVGSGTVLDGFTITGGNSPGGSGGGFYCTNAWPQLKRLFFRANHAANGAGLCARETVGAGKLMISDCLFLQNSADMNGGGMYFKASDAGMLTLTNCQFILNEANTLALVYGGGSLWVGGGSNFVEGCTFSLNSSGNEGGGIYAYNNALIRISKCRFQENTAKWGGGLSIGYYVTNVVVEVVQSVFWKNSASGDSTSAAGAIFASWGDSPTVSLYVLNSSFCSNSCPAEGGGITMRNNQSSLRIENSAFWGNGRWDQYLYTPNVRVRTSCLADANLFPGAGNFTADPKFVNGASGDLRLGTGSPCIDAGNNYMDYYPTVPGFQLLPATDLDGNWRVVDGNSDGNPKVDMGAYEYQGP